MVLKWGAVIDMCVDSMPSFFRQRTWATELDHWLGGTQGRPIGTGEEEKFGIFVPNPYKQTEEHVDLSSRAYTPWAGLVVDTLAQTMFVDGVRRAGDRGNMQAWETWQRNGWDAVQGRIYRAALGHGLAFAVVAPGKDVLTGKPMARLTPYSAKRMAAYYDEPEDEFPGYAIAMRPYYDQYMQIGWHIRFYDEEAVYYLSCVGMGFEPDDYTTISYDVHNLGVTPVVRYTNLLDLDGRATGEIEPVIPLLRRIDQDTYDRLIVQRYGAWKIRYITGLVKPKEMTDAEYQAGLMKLKVGDFLALESTDSKAGTLGETQLQGFIAARDADIRDLSAIKQIPPHHMLGTTPQMQPESLASVSASLMARSMERRISFGQTHERLFRLSALMNGNMAEAEAYDMQVRWRDTETRSLAQVADALGKIATQLKVPVEMLWEKIEGWTDSDTERAKEIVNNGALDDLFTQFERNGLKLPQGSSGGGGGNGGSAQGTSTSDSISTSTSSSSRT